MATIVFAGCGDLATGAADILHQAGHQCYGIRRTPEKLPDFIQGIKADLSDSAQLPALPDSLDYLVITLTPGEFSEQAYQRAYVGSVNNLLQSLKQQQRTPRRIFFASSTSVYHQRDGQWVDEASATEPQSFSGKAMLTAESLLQQSPFPATSIRFSGIYGPGRERMIRWAQAGASAPAEPVHFSNRIHRDDCVGVLVHLINQDLADEPLQERYLASDQQPSTFAEVLDWLREQLQVDADPAAEQAKRIRTGSKRCNSQMLQDSGYHFIYPDFRQGYADMLKALGLSG